MALASFSTSYVCSPGFASSCSTDGIIVDTVLVKIHGMSRWGHVMCLWRLKMTVGDQTTRYVSRYCGRLIAVHSVHQGCTISFNVVMIIHPMPAVLTSYKFC
jgi:hypothetical protein